MILFLIDGPEYKRKRALLLKKDLSFSTPSPKAWTFLQHTFSTFISIKCNIHYGLKINYDIASCDLVGDPCLRFTNCLHSLQWAPGYWGSSAFSGSSFVKYFQRALFLGFLFLGVAVFSPVDESSSCTSLSVLFWDGPGLGLSVIKKLNSLWQKGKLLIIHYINYRLPSVIC